MNAMSKQQIGLIESCMYAKIHDGDERMKRLSEQITDLDNTTQPTEAYLRGKAEVTRSVTDAVEKVIDGGKVFLFGSTVNGLWTPSSDLDICVHAPGAVGKPGQVQVLKLLNKEFKHVSTHKIYGHWNAIVPILHWSSKQGSLSADISVNNSLAVVNSELIREYVRTDFRVKQLGLALKLWAKARGINDRKQGTISSFSLLLMLIHFLQKRKPPVLPYLQDLAIQRNEPPLYKNGVDIRFCRDSSVIEGELKELGGLNTETVGFLFFEFFRYFAYHYVSGTVSTRERVECTATEKYLFVDNPFEVGKDVANLQACRNEKIKSELKRAHAMISQGKSLIDICSQL